MPRRNPGPRLAWRHDRDQWVIRWYERGKKRELATGRRSGEEAEAELDLAEFIAERARRRRPGDPVEPHERLISDSLSDYMIERGEKVADPERLSYCVEALLPFWGEKTAGDVTEENCDEYEDRRGKAPGTVRRELGTLQAALKRDFQKQRLSREIHVWMPPKPDSKDRWLTRQEAARLLRGARNKNNVEGVPAELHAKRRHMQLFIIMALYTAARKDAILDLRWPQVDLEEERIDFNPPGRRRTKKKRPIIPIPRRLMTFLRYARRRGTETGFVIQYGARTGKVDDIKKAFRRAAQNANLPGVSPHTLRHTAATWMTQKGVWIESISRYLGHDDSRTTERIYAHHAPDFLKDARDAMDAR